MSAFDLTLGAARRSVTVPPLLRENTDFRGFFAGQAVSLVGDQITLIALPLVGVLVLHAGAAQMGYLMTAALVPNLLFSLHAGAWVDRHGRRRQVMLVADMGRAALLATIPIAYAFGMLTLEQLYVVGFLTGALSVFFYVAYSTLFVSLVPRERYVEANSLLHGSRALSYVAGPSVGGALVQVLSAPAALVADALSFLVSAFSLSRISPSEPPTERAERGHLRAGARYIRRSSVIRSSLLATAWINFFNFVFWALFILYATRSLHTRPGVLGAVLGAASVGGVLGSLVTGRIGRRIGIGPAFVAGCILFPAPLVLPGRVPLGLRCDAARHRRRLDQGSAHSRPPAGTRGRRLHGRELRRPAARRVGRRPPRQRRRAASDALDCERRCRRRRAVPPAVADSAPA